MDPIVAGLLFGSTLLGAESQRQTNEKMVDLSNTSYQRTMADMRKAGLNPILAAKFGGSSVPTLTAPFNAGTMSSATQLAQMPSSIDKDVSQTNLNFEQVKNLESARDLNDAQIKQISNMIPLIKQQVRTEVQKTRLNFYNTGLTIAQTQGQVQNNIIRSVLSNTVEEVGLPGIPNWIIPKALDLWENFNQSLTPGRFDTDGLGDFAGFEKELTTGQQKSLFDMLDTVKDVVTDIYNDLFGESGSVSNYFGD